MLASLLLAIVPVASQPHPHADTSAIAASHRPSLPTRLAAQGLTLGAAYTVDAFAVPAHDATGALLHNVDLTATFEAEPLLGWAGTTVYLYGLANAGGSLSAHVGDLQGLSNIEAPDAIRLYEAWIDQQFGEWGSVRAGLYDLNSEFYQQGTAALFLQSAHGIGPELAGSGHHGPSIFPVTSLGLRLRVTPTPSLYAQAAVLDAVPGDPARPSATVVRLRASDGALLVGEVGLQTSSAGLAEPPALRVAVGGWGYTASFPTFDATDQTGNRGAYTVAEGTFATIGRRRLTGFGRVGVAAPAFNDVAWAWGAGVVLSDLGRPGDALGLAVATAHASTGYRDALRADGRAAAGAEWDLEATYYLPLTAWWSVQPDLHLLLHPGLAAGWTWVPGVRVTVTI